MSQKFKYIPSLDGVRAIGALLVMIMHGTYGVFDGGWIGVDLFFVLSGYLITSLLQNEFFAAGNISFLKFYIRRALRLFPPLILCIILANILWPYENSEQDKLIATWGSIFYLSNIVKVTLMGPLGHLWSLSVEEHFYLFWPLFVSAFLFRIPFNNRVTVLIIMIVFCSLLRVIIYYYEPTGILTYSIFSIESYRFSLCRMDAILMGALFAILPSNSNANDKWNNKLNLVLVIQLLILVIISVAIGRNNIYWRYGGFFFTNLFCLSIVYVAVKQPNNFLLSNQLLRWIGRRSYGIYVYHFPIFLAFEALRVPHNVGNFVLVTLLRFGASFLIAELSFRYVELPILQYKKRYQTEAEFIEVKPNIA